MRAFILVGGRPAAGKSILALAAELGLPYLAKDEVKEALMDRLGAPTTVAESRRLGSAAVAAVLRAAEGCHGAVIDSTWFDYTLPLVRRLPGPFVEVRCRVAIDVAQERYRTRVRDARHLDDLRAEDELWGADPPPLGTGPLLDVDTSEPVDIAALAEDVRRVRPRPADH